MKKTILTITIFMLSVSITKISAQNTDTLAYLQTIVANKSQYIGRPFHDLADTMKLQFKFFSPIAAIHYDKTKETSTSFGFYFPQTADDIYLTYPSLDIYWQLYLNADQSSALYSQYNGGGWNTAVYDFYKNAIIKDIQVRD